MRLYHLANNLKMSMQFSQSVAMFRLFQILGLAPYNRTKTTLYKPCPKLLILSTLYSISSLVLTIGMISVASRYPIKYSPFALGAQYLSNLFHILTCSLGYLLVVRYHAKISHFLNQHNTLRNCFRRTQKPEKFNQNADIYIVIFLVGFILTTFYYIFANYSNATSLLRLMTNFFALNVVLYFLYLGSKCHEILLLMNDEIQHGNTGDLSNWAFWRQCHTQVIDMSNTLQKVFEPIQLVEIISFFLSFLLTPIFARNGNFAGRVYWFSFYFGKFLTTLWTASRATAEVSHYLKSLRMLSFLAQIDVKIFSQIN